MTLPDADRLAALSCGHSCVLAKPRGMATNGPCHCLDGLTLDQRVRVREALEALRKMAGVA